MTYWPCFTKGCRISAEIGRKYCHSCEPHDFDPQEIRTLIGVSRYVCGQCFRDEIDPVHIVKGWK